MSRRDQMHRMLEMISNLKKDPSQILTAALYEATQVTAHSVAHTNTAMEAAEEGRKKFFECIARECGAKGE